MKTLQLSSSKGKGIVIDIEPCNGRNRIMVSVDDFNYTINEKERSAIYYLDLKHYKKLASYKSVAALIKYAKENNQYNEKETEAEDMKNIKVNYTNFNGKRTSTTIKFAIANIYYRESNLENFRKTFVLDRAKHIEAVKQTAQKFVNEQNKEDDEEMSTWEDQEMIEIAMLEESLTCSRIRTIEQMKAL